MRNALSILLVFAACAPAAADGPEVCSRPGKLDQSKTESLFEAGKAAQAAMAETNTTRRAMSDLLITLDSKIGVAEAREDNERECALAGEERAASAAAHKYLNLAGDIRRKEPTESFKRWNDEMQSITREQAKAKAEAGEHFRKADLLYSGRESSK